MRLNGAEWHFYRIWHYRHHTEAARVTHQNTSKPSCQQQPTLVSDVTCFAFSRLRCSTSLWLKRLSGSGCIGTTGAPPKSCHLLRRVHAPNDITSAETCGIAACSSRAKFDIYRYTRHVNGFLIACTTCNLNIRLGRRSCHWRSHSG